MASVTRTIGQLHFEDLEPHRFEDLVRALLYDFRQWQKLEPTGRLGSDDGYDARGWEVLNGQNNNYSETEDDEDVGKEIIEQRIWLIQCKREKRITPAKITEYLDEIAADERKNVYGIIFAAACDFSKRTRDVFNQKCIEFGFKEFFLWGKGDLEDALIQPKNDHILFSFFGISFLVRRRSLRTELRVRLATKRKAIKIFGKGETAKVAVFRDPEDIRYPYSGEYEGDTYKEYTERLRWFSRIVVETTHEGLIVLYRKRLAYLHDNGKNWDALEVGDDAVPHQYENPWEHRHNFETEQRLEYRARAFWGKLPDANRAWLEVRGLVPYDNILAIDEDGDEVVDAPQVFVKFEYDDGPFTRMWGDVEAGRKKTAVDRANKIKFFPDELPEAEPRPVQVADD